jgi:hypothetical protein
VKKNRRMIDYFRDDVANDTELSGMAVATANALIRAMHFDTLVTTPVSNETLAGWSGFSERAMRNGMAELRRGRWIHSWQDEPNRLRRGFSVGDKSASNVYRGIGRRERKRLRERDSRASEVASGRATNPKQSESERQEECISQSERHEECNRDGVQTG